MPKSRSRKNRKAKVKQRRERIEREDNRKRNEYDLMVKTALQVSSIIKKT